MTTPARRRRDADPLTQFRLYLEKIEEAVLQRDALSITALLRKRTATHLPRGVREELLAISRMSRTALRAPMRFLRFQHRMAQLAAGGERLLTAQTELVLDAPVPGGSIRRHAASDRRSAASDPKAEPPDDGTA
ncbi:MAG TPA: hypothetical protein VII52_03210 [Gemmatimonadaceae bacterium]